MGLVVNLVLDGRRAVVIGGGTMAFRRAQDLLRAGAAVRVIAAEPSAEMRSLAGSGRVKGEWRPYRDGDLAGAFVAVAATDDEDVNTRVAREANALGILVNVVDRPALCTFTMPALVRRGDLTIAVSTDGRCPSLSSLLREELEERYGPEYGDLVKRLGDLRAELIQRGWDGARIRAAIAERYAHHHG